MVPALESRLPLSERLRPSRLDDLVGNPKARQELRAWAESWRSGKPPARRAVLLVGPPGVGKTTAALALALEFGWSLVEMNASDARNQAAIEQVAGRASVSHTLAEAGPHRAHRHALILLDEADCLTGRLTETARSMPAPPGLADFLRVRYRTIEALNAAWGLTGVGRVRPFVDWESVPRSPGNASWARLPAARTDIEEWRGLQRPPDLTDRGGLAAIARLVRSTRQPIVLTVNDERPLTRYSPVFRSNVLFLRFYPIREAEMASHLERIARSERIELAEGVLPTIVRRAAGDLRAALNDLDAISVLPPGPLQLSALSARDLESDFASLTEEVLTRPRYYRSVEVRDRLDATPDDLLPWIEENIPRFAPDHQHTADALATLAVADRFLSWARRQRVYGLWSYASELLTGGVALSVREGTGSPRGGAMFPRFLGEMGRSRGLRAVREGMVAKMAKRFHLSTDKTRETLLPFMEAVFGKAHRPRSDPDWKPLARGIARELELSTEEVGLLLGVEPGSREVDALLAPDETEAARSSRGGSGRGEEPPREGQASPSPPDVDRGKVQRQLSDFGA
ncbi:MAG TPA: AAA family ATPase [Thermoplasmata archaeon]|nr:AAA family ATPase [Thermoplasmata archaeon]